LGDTNTKFFHLSTSSRACKNFIHCLQPPIGNLAVAHEEKEKIIHEQFKTHLGTTLKRGITLKWPALALAQHDLSSLEASFCLKEIKETIFLMSSDKAPSPDGFTGLFFKVCWDIIKEDILEAFHQLHSMNGADFNLLNSANIVLIPKKSDALTVGDYRHICLIHNIAKTFSKRFANRLPPPQHSNLQVPKCLHTEKMYTRQLPLCA
jgi:hypothetical protein